ncbi:MAG: YbaB/EbfC family nucleoid-associated protein [Acidobacteriaceae bacterium]|nr:YbaB/EbfC family nucleoid-associated protein [Acidobacteriaceae bacterium]
MDFSKLGEMLSAANDMKQQMDERLATTVLEADSGGGAVRVKINGKKELLSLRIDASAAQAVGSDISMLEDLIIAAVNAAGRKADEAQDSTAKGMLGNMLPGF